MNITKKDFIDLVNENTTIGSVGGFFIGPLGMVPNNVLKKRLLYPNTGIKNSDNSKSKVVEPPQGRVNEIDDIKDIEYVYSTDGNKVTTKQIMEWFEPYLDKSKLSGSSKFVVLDPKCATFPYCSQGAIDNPIKLIGENKSCMCENCYNYLKFVGEKTERSPEELAKIIREKYLKYEY